MKGGEEKMLIFILFIQIFMNSHYGPGAIQGDENTRDEQNGQGLHRSYVFVGETDGWQMSSRYKVCQKIFVKSSRQHLITRVSGWVG